MNVALPPLPAPPLALRRLIERLPTRPPSMLLALALNRTLLPRLDDAARAGLGGRAVEVHVDDFGVRCRLQLGPRGFAPAEPGAPVALRISAAAEMYWRLAEGTEDADTLFFERKLGMEGDTEFGLLLKNTLDAIGPLVPQLLARRP